MTVTIKLDSNAVNALFPEGTEARVQLQRVVAVNFLNALAVKDIKHISEELKKDVAGMIQSAMAEAGLHRFGPKFALSVEAQAEIKNKAFDYVRDTTSTIINEEITRRIPGIGDIVQARLSEVESGQLEHRIRDVLRKTLQSGLHL